MRIEQGVDLDRPFGDGIPSGTPLFATEEEQDVYREEYIGRVTPELGRWNEAHRLSMQHASPMAQSIVNILQQI